MGDEFSEPDLNTPSADELDQAYGSRFLGVMDVGARKIRTKISKVRMEEIKDRDSGKLKKRAVINFENIDKPLVLNPSNKEILNEKLGKTPAGWIGADVGIFVDPNVMFGGKKTGGVRLRVLLPPAAAANPAAPAPKPPPAKPAPAAAVEADWKEDGDPGPAFTNISAG